LLLRWNIEECRRLDYALDISQNLACYNFVPAEGVKDYAAKCLHDQGIPNDFLASDCVNLDAFVEDMLGQQGYPKTAALKKWRLNCYNKAYCRIISCFHSDCTAVVFCDSFCN
jgi:hypothetical protein